MSKSWKRAQREALGQSIPVTPREFNLMTVLADVVESTAPVRRTPAMAALLQAVRAVEDAHPKPGAKS